ncbi:DUF3127 domain-containing protein [Myroides albus]|uniref:DUF3127 domain-containing protein n=1 Tax=Myroides albus TaxID=2562892 RepID=A0A6I3LG46_9FLAO|nr:DUF3127 domain-containing protein [Myroides albus]MTG98469.1 DUF3127 domain-containing protein [Myroides albus]UVD78226.1 DUF3127 domain-containing protein [Myroides albus]
MEVTGRIKLIGHIQDISSSFRKREVVVTTDEQYPQHIMIEFTQDRVSLLDTFQVGEPVRVSINLRGREWVSPQGETRYFNTIQGWRIEKAAAGQPGPDMQQMPNQGFGGNNMNQGGFGNQGQQNQGFQQQQTQQGGFNQSNDGSQFNNQQGGFNNQAQQGQGFQQQQTQQGGFNQGNQGMYAQNQGQNQFNQFGQQNTGNQFPPASSYNEEEHDDLPF